MNERHINIKYGNKCETISGRWSIFLVVLVKCWFNRYKKFRLFQYDVREWLLSSLWKSAGSPDRLQRCAVWENGWVCALWADPQWPLLTGVSWDNLLKLLLFSWCGCCALEAVVVALRGVAGTSSQVPVLSRHLCFSFLFLTLVFLCISWVTFQLRTFVSLTLFTLFP